MDAISFQAPGAKSLFSEPTMPSASVTPHERDPLLVCLALTAKRIDREVHLSALRAGFALDEEGRIPMNAYPDLARSAERWTSRSIRLAVKARQTSKGSRAWGGVTLAEGMVGSPNRLLASVA